MATEFEPGISVGLSISCAVSIGFAFILECGGQPPESIRKTSLGTGQPPESIRKTSMGTSLGTSNELPP